METRDRHGATKRNIMALVMHAYLICGEVGEVHLIFSAILAAGLLVMRLTQAACHPAVQKCVAVPFVNGR